MMISAKNIGIRLGVAVSIFILLSILWKPIHPVCTTFFKNAFHQTVVRPFNNVLDYKISLFNDNKKSDLAIVFFNKNERYLAQRTANQVGEMVRLKQGRVGISTWYIFYLPICLFVSLLIASHVSMDRKLRVLLLGSVLILLFGYLKLYFTLFFYVDNSGMSPLSDGSFLTTLGVFLYKTISVNPAANATIPVIIWLLLTFRKKDFQQLLTIL